MTRGTFFQSPVLVTVPPLVPIPYRQVFPKVLLHTFLVHWPFAAMTLHTPPWESAVIRSARSLRTPHLRHLQKMSNAQISQWSLHFLVLFKSLVLSSAHGESPMWHIRTPFGFCCIKSYNNWIIHIGTQCPFAYGEKGMHNVVILVSHINSMSHVYMFFFMLLVFFFIDYTALSDTRVYVTYCGFLLTK